MATILLVDDVKLFLELERSFLEPEGHQLLSADSGEAALEALNEFEPDLLLLDLYLPGLDGDEVCRRLRNTERWRNLPIIMVTAAGKGEDISKCLAAGCNDYVTKPINKNALLEKVQRNLGVTKSRTAERTPVTLRVQVRGEGKSLSATAKDISRNGIYVKSPVTLTQGAPVELRVELPEGRQLPMLGKVMRVQPGPEGGMGIYFVNPEPQGLRALQQLINQESAQAEEQTPEVVRRVGELEIANAELQQQKRSLRQRIAELESENREFAERIVQTEEVNNNLTNLYVASSRLHSTLDRSEVLQVITEVVINFVGAEKFALLMFDKNSAKLSFQAGEGLEAADFPEMVGGKGLLELTASTGQSYYQEGSVAAGSDDPLKPLAVIPLRIHDETMAVLAVYRLFVQKEEFQPVDYQLFHMLAEHAATALFTATIYQDSERKRATYKGFVDLLLK